MSKKKKIIISSICIGVILIGIILSLVLVNIKKYSTYTESKISYNNHSKMSAGGFGTAYHTNNSNMYENGTQIILDNTDKYGLYSWKTDDILIAAEYDEITCVKSSTKANKSYFQLINNNRPNQIKLVDEEGKLLNSVTYDETEAKTFTTIKTKTVKVKESWGNLKASTSRTEDKQVYITSYVFDGEYMGDGYHYEIWKLTTEDGHVYRNIYDMTEGRELVQTMGAKIGLDFATESLELVVLSDGEIRFVSVTTNDTQDGSKSATYNIYDKDYDLINNAVINASKFENASSILVPVGDNLLIQTKEMATEKKYDFTETTDTEIKYYNYTTYKLSMKTGKLTENKIDYVINTEATDPYAVINNNTTVLDVRKIKDKQAEDTTFIVINNRFQTKEIGFAIDSITQINEDRYIAVADTGIYGKSYNLIDNNYNLVCKLGDIDSYFTTKDSLIIEKDDSTYICDLNGLIVKTYENNEVINIYHEDYYMVKVSSVVEGKNKTEYYLERLSQRESTPISSKVDTETAYISGDRTYEKVVLTYNENFSLVTKITKIADTNFRYEIYNFDGKLLLTMDMVADTAKTISLYDSTSVGEDYVIVSFDGKGFVLDR